jgi:hypothetical protein
MHSLIGVIPVVSCEPRLKANRKIRERIEILMGRSNRPKPARLHQKLLQIRLALGLTQPGMLRHLDYHKSPVYEGHISEFELGKRVPALPLLLRYARVGGVSMEALVDDEMDLPVGVKTESRRARMG